MSSWDRIRVQEPNAARALLGGLIATILVTALMYIAGGLGIRVWNVPAIVGGALSFNARIHPGDAMWVWGLAFYLACNIFAFPACYAYWVYDVLPGPTWMRGLLFGAFLWFILEMLLMPLIGEGVFDLRGPAPAFEIISQLILWLLYGAVLGAIAGPQELWQQRPHQVRPA